MDKSLIATDNADTTSSGGLGDLIIFTRFSIYNKDENFKREIDASHPNRKFRKSNERVFYHSIRIFKISCYGL